MKTNFLVKLIIASILINYAFTYTVNGTCKLGSKKWDCKVKTTTGWQIEVSGATSNLPAYNYDGAIKLPYAFVENVSQDIEWTTWLIFPDPYTVFTINMNKLGVRHTLVVEIDDTSSANYLAYDINLYRGQRQSKLKTVKNSIISQAGTYNTKVAYLNSNNSSYSSDSNRINFLNNEIASKSATITTSTAERNNLVIENNKLQPSVASKLSIRDQKSKILSECKNESLSVGDLLRTYEKYNREFNPDEVAEFLDKEYNNLCLFHLAAEDLTLIVPNQVSQINKARKEVTKNRDMNVVRDLFNSDEFYILSDFN